MKNTRNSARRAQAETQASISRAEAVRERAAARANSPVPTTFLGKLRWLFS